MEAIIGVDWGASHLTVASSPDQSPDKILNIPINVAFTDPGRYYTGERITEAEFLNYPTQVLLDFHHLLYLLDHSCSLLRQKWLPYRVIHQDNEVLLQLGEAPNYFDVPLKHALCSFFQDFARQVGFDHRLVIAAPACLGGKARRLFVTTCPLTVERFCDTAWALARYWSQQGEQRDQVIALCDMGHSKFEVSILYFDGHGQGMVVGSASGVELGIYDLDLRVAEWIYQHISADHANEQWYELPRVRARILMEAQALRKQLLASQEAEVLLPFLHQLGTVTVHYPQDRKLIITQEQIGGLYIDVLGRIEEVCLQAMDTARIDRYDVDRVVWAGTPAAGVTLERSIGKVFGKTPVTLKYPRQVVAKGTFLASDMSLPADFWPALQSVERRHWSTFFDELRAHGPAFAEYIQFILRMGMGHMLREQPEFLLRLYRLRLEDVVRHLSPEQRPQVIEGLYPFRAELMSLPDAVLLLILQGCIYSQPQDVLKVYRRYGEKGVRLILEHKSVNPVMIMIRSFLQ